jgi:23S rRNA (adenine2503-C2)-methyltransferase
MNNFIMDKTRLIYDLDLPNLSELLSSWHEPKYRAQQIWEGLYRNLWHTPAQFSQLPRSLRSKLAETFTLEKNETATLCQLYPSTTLDSTDGETRKTLFNLADGRLVEAVLMHYNRRRTLCISSQSGCAMGCSFCATGQMGFGRHLTSGEIVEQVLYYARSLAVTRETVTNVVVMGMGEPFHNYEATMGAIDRLNHAQGFNLGARRFTISTVGLVPAIRRFTAEKRQVNLAVSLHAADDDLRSSMLPINKKYPLAELVQACQEYIDQTRRRITFEWALIEGVNDTIEQAQKLAALLRPFRIGTAMLCHVNAIPLNPTRNYSGKATPQNRAKIFCEELDHQGIPCTLRLRRGIDIQAGCGQLAGKETFL